MGKKPMPADEKKVRVLVFIEPDIITEITKKKCQEIAKIAIRKNYIKQLKQNKKL